MATPPKKKTMSEYSTPLRGFPVKGTPGKEFSRGFRPLVKGISLTPIRKRRTRISLSPAKAAKEASALKHHSSMEFGTSTQTFADESGRNTVIDVPTSSLDFEEFSFMGPNGWLDYHNLTEEQNKTLRDYLIDKFNLISIAYQFPFLVLECAGDAPSEDNRPFTIAGAIAVWQSENYGAFLPFFGEDAGGDDIEIDDQIVAMMKPLTLPPQEVIDFFALKLFPDCVGLAIIYNTIVVELPKMDHETFINRLQTLPGGIRRIPFLLHYWNGPLPNSERRGRVVKPRPEVEANQVADETDYVRLDGKFYPGTMIQSQPFPQKDSEGNWTSASGQVTAGILVEKNGEKRLTCSYHNWEPLVEGAPGLLGQSTSDAKLKFQVLQGDPGTNVGFLRERMGDTDVALAQLDSDISFDNKFMEVEAEPKKLVRSTDCKPGDEYIIDSFAVGKQKLRGMGWRFVKRTGGRGAFYHEEVKTIDKTKEPQENQTYVELVQGIHATTSPVMRQMPHIRDSVCGSVLLKTRELGANGKMDVLHEGKICGMLHYADLQLKNVQRAEYFLCYADVFDSLIDDGWTVAH